MSFPNVRPYRVTVFFRGGKVDGTDVAPQVLATVDVLAVSPQAASLAAAWKVPSEFQSAEAAVYMDFATTDILAGGIPPR